MTSEVQPADVSLRDLEERWSLSRNGLKARARALGVELRRVSSTLTVWPGDFIDLGDQLDEHLKAGKPQGTFPGLAPVDPSKASSITKASGVSADDLAGAIAKAMGGTLSLPAPQVDPLRRAKALAEAADNALVLTTDELAALGVKGVDGFVDGDLAFGYVFNKHQQRNRTLWTVARAIAKRPASDGSATALAPSKTDKQVGFGLGATMGATLFATNALR